jgi:hypothetical protein
LLNAGKALLEKGQTPPGSTPESQRVRSAALLLRRDQKFQEAAADALIAVPGKPHVTV